MKEYKLKSEEIIKLVELKGGCIASDKITIDGLKIGYMYRENPSNEFDSGWRFLLPRKSAYFLRWYRKSKRKNT